MFTPDNAVLYVGREHTLSEEQLKSDKLLQALKDNEICNPQEFSPVKFIDAEEVRGKVIIGIPPKPYLALLADACVSFPIDSDNRSMYRGAKSRFLTPTNPYKKKKPIAYRTKRNYDLEQILYKPDVFFTEETLRNTVGIGFSRNDFAEYVVKWMGCSTEQEIGGGIQARSEDLASMNVVSCARWFIPFYKQILCERLIHLKINLSKAILENMDDIALKIIEAEHDATFVYEVDEVELEPLMGADAA